MKLDNVTVRIEENELRVYIGNAKLISFLVHDRFNYDGGKRGRNTAVFMCVHQLNSTWDNRFLSQSLYIDKAIGWMASLGIDSVASGFIDLCIQRGWSKELPPQYTGQGELL